VADTLSRQDELDPKEKPKEQFINLLEIEEEGELAYILDAMTTDLSIRDITREYLKEHQEESPKMMTWEDELPVYQGRIWVPNKLMIQWKILQLYHDSPMAGHQGITGTSELVARGYYWPDLNEYVTNYMNGCKTCQMAKKRSIKAHGKLKLLEVPEGPWQWTESDLIAPLPLSRGKNAIYMVCGKSSLQVSVA